MTRSVKRSAAQKVARLVVRPVIRRLLMMAAVAVAGWLLGVAGQAHADQAYADTVPGARLPSVAAQAESVTAIADHVLPTRRVVPAVRTAGAVLAPARPPAILALPPAATSALADATRPRAPEGSAGPSRTRRHGGAGSRAGVTGAPVSHIGTHAAPGASGKAFADHGSHKAKKRMTKKRKTAPVPSTPGQPGPLPQRGQALPPSADNGVTHQVGVRRKTEPGTAHSRPAIPILRTGTVPPAVRTAADEPTFSPD
ncbi:MAG: hypothetical protein ACRDP6_11020 [Actinoallomurus sp.]